MTTFAVEPARYHSGPYFVTKVPEAANQSFKQGEFVYLVNGKATVCADDAVTIWGQALQDASTTTDTSLEVLVLQENMLFEMTVYEDGGGSNDVYAVTDRGVKYAYEVVSNRACLNTSDTDADALVIVEPRDAVGDIYPRVYAKFLPAVMQCGAAGT